MNDAAEGRALSTVHHGPVSSRQAVRVLLLDEADRVLLVRFWDDDRSWWCTPGGGIEPGETDEAAAQREIREELGHDPVGLGPCIWTRRHIGIFRGRPFDQSERIYLGRVAAFEPRPSLEALREHALADIRWWTLDELADSTEEFAPRRLPALARAVVSIGPPESPVDVGV
jgi:8-oxo-dGTP pyrophosphatase MutT (NUDIX family)